MTLDELETQALQLSLSDRWRFVQFLLSSIREEILVSNRPTERVNSLTDCDPWTQSLMGVVRLEAGDPLESYIDYLEKKYS